MRLSNQQWLAVAVIILALGIFWVKNREVRRAQLQAIETEEGLKVDLPERRTHQLIENDSAPATAQGKALAAGEVLAETPACRSLQKSDSIILSASEIPQLYRKGAQITVPIDQERVCLRSGQEISLLFRGRESPEFLQLRGSGSVSSITRGAREIQVQLAERWLGMNTVLARDCRGYCDSIIDGLNDVSGTGRVLLDLRAKNEIDQWAPKGARSVVINYDDQLMNIRNQIGPIQGIDFVVMTSGPFWYRRNILHIMKGLKEAGARNVSWFYEGSAGARGVPFRPPVPEGVVAIPVTEVKELLQKGAKLYFVSSEAAPDKNAIPGSLHVRTRRESFQPGSVINSDYLKDRSSPGEFNGHDLPTDPRMPTIVYGYTNMDWRPYHLLNLLSRRGFKNLFWVQGGIDEYKEAKNFQLME
ncbi:MAG: hypothetical protein KF802_11665 [Bdellovibrionaceae bacterium]|nr:hypothetical protein [Pseudobdellovibrionaceae bacterium]